MARREALAKKAPVSGFKQPGISLLYFQTDQLGHGSPRILCMQSIPDGKFSPGKFQKPDCRGMELWLWEELGSSLSESAGSADLPFL